MVHCDNQFNFGQQNHQQIYLMNNNYQSSNNVGMQLFGDWLNPSTGRRSRSKSQAILQEFKQDNVKVEQPGLGFFMIEDLIKKSDIKVEQQFQQAFLFGVQMQIWRKGRIKPVTVFIDCHLPHLLWISSKTKAFLFDLTYTTVNRFDYQLQMASKVKDYIILHYFQEQIPILFRKDKKQADKYFQLFNNYIIYNQLSQVYPPFFSRIMKLYTTEGVKDNILRKKKATDILKVSENIGFTDSKTNWRIMDLINFKNSGQKLATNTQLSDNQLSQYFKILHCCQKVKEVFQSYSGAKISNQLEYLKPLMKKQAFMNFLRHQQKQQEQTISQILEQTQDFLSFDDFCSYLESQKSNYAVNSPQVNQNLPLTDYFCYSSHNTYLTGNQLTSDSKIQRYIQDLSGGLKCVQIDVHNDGERPIITHALNDKSLCKPIDFEETIIEISRFCELHPNHYPIILSIQNHAKEENRYKMLNIIVKYLDKKLFLVHKVHEDSQPKISKTLYQLKGKIILKTDSKIQQLSAFRKKILTHPINNIILPIFMPDPTFPISQFQQKYDSFQKRLRKLQIRKNIFEVSIPKTLFLPLAQMTKLTGMFKSPTGIQNATSTGYECTSLTIQKAIKTAQQKIINYSKRSWLRIYPMGSQIASSNYNPLPVLKLGAQIIALNTQTKDDHAWLMMSYFTAGRAPIAAKIGFVEKPIHLRSDQPKIIMNKSVQIKILSSNQKISIKFYGTEPDMKLNQNASLNFQVRDYEQGFLMFNIGQKLKDCIPLRFIRKGYRVLIAKNQMFRDSGVRIIIHISIKQL